MIPQNEAQMNESAIADEFEKYWMSTFEGMSSNDIIKYREVGRSSVLQGFKAAYSSQQEKIEKLEASYNKLSEAFDDLNVQNNFHAAQVINFKNSCEHLMDAMTKTSQSNSALSEENKSLRGDLEWCFSKFRQMLPRMSESYGLGVEEVIKEIRQRHGLDKSEDV